MGRTARIPSCRAIVGVAILTGLVVGAGCGDAGGDATRRPDDESSRSGGHGATTPVAEGSEHIAITARSFAYEPEQLTVEVGEDVAIALSSEDGLHDLTIDELGVHVVAEAGETSVGGLRAGELGEYAVYCSVEGHREAGMEGALVVEER